MGRRCILTVIAMSTAAAGCATERAETHRAVHRREPDGGRTVERDAPALLAAESALREDRPSEAERLFLQAAAASPGDPRAHVGLARARLALGRRDEALADLGRSLAAAETAEALSLRGRTLALARRFDEAALDLERAVALAPGDASAWAVLGAVQVNRGDDVEAERAFGAVVRLLGKVEGPDRFWTQLLSMPPDPVHPQESLDRCTRGRVALFQGLWIDAHAEHLNGLRYSPRFLWCIAGLAEAAWRLGAAAQAEQSLRSVIRAYPDTLAPLRADAQGKLGALLVSQGRAPAEAASLARAALEVRGERAALLDVLGRACDAAGDRGCATHAFHRLLDRPHVPAELRARAEARLADLGASASPSR